MTSFDFLSGFNNIDPKFILDAIDLMQTVEASDAEKEIMNMENYTIHKKRTVRRSVLVAAAVIALLCAMCVGAYAVNLFGIRDAVMGRQIVSDSYVNGEYAGKKLADGMTISMQGCIGSPEYEASREFNAFLSTYEANGYNGDALHQPLGDWGEAHRRLYNGLYTETLVNKFLEISEKYALKPWDDLYEGSGYLKTKRVSDSVNMEDLTRMMRYNSCAELETILNEAAVRAAFARKTGIDMEDMVSVVLKQQYGAQEDMPRVSDEVIEKVALHEAGHLVVCEALCPGGVGFASLLPSDENRCGGFIHCCKGVSDSQSAIIALGGKAAVEMRYAGQVAEGCSDDIARAVNCIREAAAKEGTLGFSLLNVESDSSSNMSESLNARSEAAVQAELERYYGKARALLAQNEAFLKEITEALVMKKTLLYSDIQAIRGTAVKRNPAVTCEAASRYDAAEIENSPPEDPEEAIRQKIMRKLEEAERRRCS